MREKKGRRKEGVWGGKEERRRRMMACVACMHASWLCYCGLKHGGMTRGHHEFECRHFAEQSTYSHSTALMKALMKGKGSKAK